MRAIAAALLPRHPAQAIATGFGLAIALGTAALMLPVTKVGPGGAGFMEALFTATSAVCVTGLATVDTDMYWTPLGHAVILVLIQLGGFGVMAFATLLGVLMARRLGLRSKMQAAAETKSTGFGDLKSMLMGILRITVLVELAVAIALALRFGIGYGYSVGQAAWLGIFHSISGFNNAGFALFSGNLMDFVTDPWVCLPIAAAIVVGGLGFPVLFELGRHFRKPLHWSMNSKLVLSGTGILLAVALSLLARSNGKTQTLLGPYQPAARCSPDSFSPLLPEPLDSTPWTLHTWTRPPGWALMS